VPEPKIGFPVPQTWYALFVD